MAMSTMCTYVFRMLNKLRSDVQTGAGNTRRRALCAQAAGIMTEHCLPHALWSCQRDCGAV